MLEQLNFLHKRTLARAKKCVLFFETMKLVQHVPLTTKEIDEYTSSGSCKTGAALRSCIRKSREAKSALNMPACYQVNENQLELLKLMIKNFDGWTPDAILERIKNK